MQRLERNLLVIILLLSALLSISILTRGHLWWDDFASYLMQAQSLLNGSPANFIQHNRFTIENSSYPPGPVAYPWGFPILLAPVLALFGMKLLALKLLNTLFFLFFLLAFYFLARLRMPASWALTVTAVLAFNPALLAAHDLILSDIPFLFFSTLAILIIESQDEMPTPRHAALTGLAIYLAFSLRTNGILLLIPLFIHQALGLKPANLWAARWRLLLPYLVFSALFIIQTLLLPGGQESYFSHFSMLSIGSLFNNLFYYSRLPAEFVKNIPLGLVFVWAAGLLTMGGIFSSFRRNLPILSYILASLVLFITWPETQGLRFIYPLLPLLLLPAAAGLQFFIQKSSGRTQKGIGTAGSILAGAFLLLSIFVSARHAINNLRQGREINGPFDPISGEMFEFIREDTPPDSIVIFFKPRVMRLLTERDAFMTQQCDDLPRGDYIVIHEKQGANGQIPDLSVCPQADYLPVFNNKRFTVYQVDH